MATIFALHTWSAICFQNGCHGRTYNAPWQQKENSEVLWSREIVIFHQFYCTFEVYYTAFIS